MAIIIIAQNVKFGLIFWRLKNVAKLFVLLHFAAFNNNNNNDDYDEDDFNLEFAPSEMDANCDNFASKSVWQQQ